MMWRKLPSDRRHKVIVLVGRPALRRLRAAVAAKEADHDPPIVAGTNATGQNPRPPS